MSSSENIQYIYKSRESQARALNNANGPLLFIGEWVHEWNATSRSQTDYHDFRSAQLEVYNSASFGWAYWTLKNDRKHWDFEWNIRNDYLQLQPGTPSTVASPFPESIPLGYSTAKHIHSSLHFLTLVYCWLFRYLF